MQVSGGHVQQWPVVYTVLAVLTRFACTAEVKEVPRTGTSHRGVPAQDRDEVLFIGSPRGEYLVDLDYRSRAI